MGRVPERPSLDGLEARWGARWEADGAYRFDPARPREDVYAIDFPPLTVSGSLHLGHVFSYCHTDILARFQRMRGRAVFYPVGFDDNGLPTERRVENFYGVRCDPSLPYDPGFTPPDRPGPRKQPISRPNFIELCLRLTEADERVFEALWRQLGLSVDWSLAYTTVGERARRASQRGFLHLLAKGEAYQAEAPTLWDVTYRTAVAQAEIEDREVPGVAVQVRFHPEGSGEPQGGAPVGREGSGEPQGGAPVRPLEAGERVLLQDVKGRRYLITLERGATFHTHRGRLAHDQLIGSAEGMVASTDLGQRLLVLRPTLADWVVKMPRGAQVIYPKVLALMVMAADVQPGMTVVEAGTGSGALSIALLQALAPGGRLHSFERRPDFADQARRNVERWFGKAPDGFQLHEGDVVDGIADLGPVDRVLLDLLEPWLVVGGAAAALCPGGVLVCFLATVPQVMRLVEALEGSGSFGLVETSEAIFRPWHVDGLAVRPEHRMIGHTGFLVSARRVDGPWRSPGRIP